LLTFDTGDQAECGAGGPTDQNLRPVMLQLDRKGYRIPLGWRAAMAPRQRRRAALTVSAEKSSRHAFRVVLELTGGRTVSTPRFDLVFFKPNIVEPTSN
jgi:hypothetical protein